MFSVTVWFWLPSRPCSTNKTRDWKEKKHLGHSAACCSGILHDRNCLRASTSATLQANERTEHPHNQIWSPGHPWQGRGGAGERTARDQEGSLLIARKLHEVPFNPAQYSMKFKFVFMLLRCGLVQHSDAAFTLNLLCTTNGQRRSHSGEISSVVSRKCLMISVAATRFQYFFHLSETWKAPVRMNRKSCIFLTRPASVYTWADTSSIPPCKNYATASSKKLKNY